MSACPSCNAQISDGARFCPACGSTVPVMNQGEDEDPLLGKVIARNFRVESLLGTGGMGRVYKARQISLDKAIVLKVLHPQFNNDPQLVQRFHREARAASRLNHPNSISIIDFGQAEDGTLFMAMELLHGKDLFTLIQQEFPLPEERLARIMIQVCSALAEAHAENIIHRDLKPENIMVEDRRDQKDFVKVLDFGIAKIQDPQDSEGRALTQQGMVCGTPEYMSPEQARGENLDPRSDIYALGVLMFQLTTGDLPFKADSPLGIVTKHITEPPPKPQDVRPDLAITDGVQGIILKCLEKHPERRFQTAHDLGDAWRAWVEQRMDAARHAAAAPKAAEPPRRSTMAMGTPMTFPPPEAVEVAPTPARVTTRTEASFPSDPSMPANGAARPNSSVAVAPVKGSLTAGDLAAVRRSSAGLYMGIAGLALFAAAGAVYFFDEDGPPKGNNLPITDVKQDPVETQKDPVETQKDPVETQKDPVETKKDPVEVKKDPVEVKKDPVEVKKDPVEVKKDPVETKKDPVETKKDPVTKKDPAEKPPKDVKKPPPDGQSEDGDGDGRAEAIRELMGNAEKRMNTSDYEKAISLLEQVRKAVPRDARAARMLGDAHLQNGDLGAACPHYRDFVKLAPKDPKAAAVKARLKGCD